MEGNSAASGEVGGAGGFGSQGGRGASDLSVVYSNNELKLIGFWTFYQMFLKWVHRLSLSLGAAGVPLFESTRI